MFLMFFFFFFQAEDGIRDAQESRGLGDVYKRQEKDLPENQEAPEGKGKTSGDDETASAPETDPVAIEKKKKSTINSQVTMKKMFDSGKPNDFCSPITSCDWNADDPEVVGCCSIDTTVTIWNIEQGVHTMQLIAHDKEVYDIAFAKGTHTFASCGADGSVRIFDLRDMEHCTIVYETCLLYTSDAADEEDSVDLGGRRIIKKKKKLEIRDPRGCKKVSVK
eukprot:TRINITY_DN3871_c0_g1_i4.p1 TRINITY_DN3871_c0_g1~~TRINITY_DN3871_c0_g1_i4.p1  ORF type:complete len:221 (+),score=69.10 TRINITY_DN3871_c0_g1_i4:106-768(+)